ncbi:proline-rich protein 2 [Centropristis striata]|uniref:proline-rich protein 2 n=1 Tax=Centropristis striata TaxID=184440 RepID=UPI0027DF135D|nr:proline-rich protein 2 [Centropristis striata]
METPSETFLRLRSTQLHQQPAQGPFVYYEDKPATTTGPREPTTKNPPPPPDPENPPPRTCHHLEAENPPPQEPASTRSPRVRHHQEPENLPPLRTCHHLEPWKPATTENPRAHRNRAPCPATQSPPPPRTHHHLEPENPPPPRARLNQEPKSPPPRESKDLPPLRTRHHREPESPPPSSGFCSRPHEVAADSCGQRVCRPSPRFIPPIRPVASRPADGCCHLNMLTGRPHPAAASYPRNERAGAGARGLSGAGARGWGLGARALELLQTPPSNPPDLQTSRPTQG